MKGFTNTRGSNKENGPSQVIRSSRLPLADITNEVDWLGRSLESDRPVAVNNGISQAARRSRTTAAHKRNKVPTGRVFGSSSSANVATHRQVSENLQSSAENSLGDEVLLSPPTTGPSGSSRPLLGQIAPSFVPAITSSSMTDLAHQFSKICGPEPGASSFGDREPWTTGQVPPKTHKTTSGQLVVLPSHSTLVDFREGERRKGKKGGEVIVVSPDGLHIQVFSAPHLSTPCCLAEPHATYTLSTLPTPYYKLYEQARKVIERIKKKIPKLVMYEADSTCTLMINEPQADIQVCLDACTGAPETALLPAVRVRLSRKLLSVEISTTTGSRENGGEWNHKVLFWKGRDTGVGAEELRRLSVRERRAVHILSDFFPVVDRVEQLRDSRTSYEDPIVVDNRKTTAQLNRKRSVNRMEAESPAERVLDRSLTRKRTAVAFSPGYRVNTNGSSTPSFATVGISPRPRLGLGASPAKTPITRKVSSTVVNSRPQSATGREWTISKENLSRPPAPGVDMRFLPSIGWCIRFGKGAGVYRIMFFDGAVLEISVEDEHVEFMTRDGYIERSTIRDCHAQRDVGERMKAFEEFVSLFEEHDNLDGN